MLPHAYMLQQMPEAIIFADPDGIIRFWNTASEAIFGFCAAEAVGQSLDIIIPEHLRAAHWRGFHAAVASGQTKHAGHATRTKAQHQNGGFIYAEVSFCLIKDDGGNVLGSLSCVRPAAPKTA